MNKWILLSFIMVIICVFGITYFIKTKTLPAISFFPPDDQSEFVSADSDITIDTDKTSESNEIRWTSDSTSDKNMYLRQDVSLLFDNGKLRGALSKWKQNTDQIDINKTVSIIDSSFFQVISYHHGEIHSSDNTIKSIQQMSTANLYVIDTDSATLKTFKFPKNKEETAWKNLLERTTKQQLLFHWNQLFNHFDIDTDSYLAVPITSLNKYNDTPLPSMSQAQTNQIVGQLWEGLYKNYIIPAANSKKKQENSFIPIVLFDKQQDHLFVLFELNGKKQKLIQRYSD